MSFQLGWPVRFFMWGVAAALLAAPRPAVISVAGQWQFRLDAANRGLAEGWFKGELPDRIPLPGSTDEHRYGTKTTAAEPRRLTRAYEYVGPAWYSREIEIPAAWADARVVLFLERCHWETQAWIDGKPVGLRNSLSTPQRFELGPDAKPGRHRLTLRVDNTLKIDVGMSSATMEEGPSNWNGVTGRLELQATDPVWIESLRVEAGARRETVRVEAVLRNNTGRAHVADLESVVSRRGAPGGVARTPGRAAIAAGASTRLTLEAPVTAPLEWWSEFSPVLYDVKLTLTAAPEGQKWEAEGAASFGLRTFERQGRNIVWNGRRAFLRGTVDNSSFPVKGYPHTELAEWRERLGVYRAYGMNHARFHSWCPPEAAFVAADELGMILQVENPLWVGHGRISADSLRTAFIREEAHRIVAEFGNHPSFALMSMGNELGNGLDPFLSQLVRDLRAADPRRLYTSTSAPDDPRRPDDYFVSADPKWQDLRGDPRFFRRPPDTAYDYRGYMERMDRPLISHEVAQWTVFPNFDEARKYTGAQQPRYLDLYRAMLAPRNLMRQVEEFRRASGAWMMELYKEEIESSLRTHALAGFQILGLTDWLGYGPAFVGVLDVFGETKGLTTPEEFRRFCDRTVLLLRMPARVWTTGGQFAADAEVAHYGAAPLRLRPSWRVQDAAGKVVLSGALEEREAAPGGSTLLGTLRFPLDGLAAPARYSVELASGEAKNAWSFWVYPKALPATPDDAVLVTGAWDAPAKAALAAGRRVLLMLPRETKNTVAASFTTAFWSAKWFPNRGETMGVLCRPDHKALAAFPTAAHSDWQWWDLTNKSHALILDDAPQSLQPIVQVIDVPERNHRLAALFEARVGRGRLMLTTFDLARDLVERPAARQMRHSLLRYLASEDFRPAAALTVEQLDALLAAKRP